MVIGRACGPLALGKYGCVWFLTICALPIFANYWLAKKLAKGLLAFIGKICEEVGKIPLATKCWLPTRSGLRSARCSSRKGWTQSGPRPASWRRQGLWVCGCCSWCCVALVFRVVIMSWACTYVFFYQCSKTQSFSVFSREKKNLSHLMIYLENHGSKNRMVWTTIL